jgi:hypothetical protein
LEGNLEVEDDVWGVGCQIVIKEIGCAAPIVPMDVAREEISALFTQHPRFRDDESSEEIPERRYS